MKPVTQFINSAVDRLRSRQVTHKRFTLIVALCCIPLMALAWLLAPMHIAGFPLLRYAALGCVLLLICCFPVNVASEHVFMVPTLPVAVAAAFLYGPFAAALLMIVCKPIVVLRGRPTGARSRESWRWYVWNCLHNVALEAAAILVPTIVYQILINLHAFPAHSFAAGVALSAAVVAQFYINAALVTTLASLWSGARWDVIWHNNFRWTLPITVLLSPLGFLMGALTEQNLLLGICFISLPIMAINRGYALHESQLRTYRSGVEMLGRLMQESHPYTHGHLNRVARWATKIAQRMNLPADSIEHVENAAILHDIGKIAIDDRILNKVEKLTDDEWAKIRQHPVVGAEIAAKMKYLDHVSVWIRHHHERMDGKGYPDGLIGEHIPIESKIICAVDAFDAMVGGPTKTDQRPYRKAKTTEEAREELARCSGTQFDADVVTAFLMVLDEEAIEEREARESAIVTPRLTLVARSPFRVGHVVDSECDVFSLRGAA